MRKRKLLMGCLLAVFAVAPAYVFPEWIPESLGDFSKWAARFWDLTGAAAQPVPEKRTDCNHQQNQNAAKQRGLQQIVKHRHAAHGSSSLTGLFLWYTS